jgi:hypothetical protein
MPQNASRMHLAPSVPVGSTEKILSFHSVKDTRSPRRQARVILLFTL